MLNFLTAWFSTQVAKIRQEGSDKGASTVELVILTVALIAIAVALALLITNVYNNRSTGIF